MKKLSIRHSQYQKHPNTYKNINVETRIAKYTDIPSLINISRKCFPDKAIWQAPHFFAKKMWEAILSWNNNEIWVYSLDGRVSGFITLVKDFNSFSKEWRKQRGNFLFAKTLTLILSPKLMLYKVWKKTLAYLRRFKNDKSNFNILPQFYGCKPVDEVIRRSRTGIARYGNATGVNPWMFTLSELQNENHLWIAILAVAPKMRRRGIAKAMIKHAIKRVVELGKEAAALKVDIRNRPAQKLYEKLDFTYICSDLNYCYYEINVNTKTHRNVAS